MHFTQSFVSLQFCYQFYGSLILVGIFGACASFCLALMTIYGTGGIELALAFSFVGLIGLLRILMPPWTTIADHEHVYFPLDIDCQTKLLDELAVDTMILGQETKDNDDLLDPLVLQNTPCSICLQCFEIGQEVSVVIGCGHTFHSNCLQKWIQKSATCPYCRQDIEKKLPMEEGSDNGGRRKLPGALGIFEGAFDSIYDLTS